MKKLLLSLFALATVSANAQVFSEDFSNGMPSSFTLINNDGSTPASAVSYVNDAWVVATSTATGNKYAVSTSWYTPAGPADDWMVTPQIAIPSANTFLIWKAGAPDQAYNDGYEVRISTTGTSIADFTAAPVYTSTGEQAPYVTRSVDLSSYSGQSVYIAFRNNSNDKFLLYVDDIMVETFTSLDMAGGSSSLSPYAEVGSAVDITATFNNNGLPVTSAKFNYSVNGGAAVSQTLSSFNAGVASTVEVTHPTAWTPAAAGNYTIKMWLSDLNGNSDADNSNDTITVRVEAAAAVTRNLLAEEFSSSTCPPCKSWNDNVYNTALANYNSGNNKIVVKYQVPIPVAGDPSHNGDADARRAYYGINSAPSMVVNGEVVDYDNAPGTTWADAATYFNQVTADGLLTPAFVNITGGADYKPLTANTAEITVNATINSNIDLTSGDYRAHIVVMNEHYTFNGATNGDFQYHHVMRKMLPSANGTTLNISAGNSQSITESYTFTLGNVTENSFRLWNDDVEVLIIVENTANQQIMNAALAPVNVIGLEESKGNFNLHTYPNPARETIFVTGDVVSQDTKVEVVSSTGQMVYSQQFSGESVLQVPVADLKAGLYMLNVTIDGKTDSKKISIVQ